MRHITLKEIRQLHGLDVLSTVGPRNRYIFKLYLEGVPQSEIAETLGRSAGTIQHVVASRRTAA